MRTDKFTTRVLTIELLTPIEHRQLKLMTVDHLLRIPNTTEYSMLTSALLPTVTTLLLLRLDCTNYSSIYKIPSLFKQGREE